MTGRWLHSGWLFRRVVVVSHPEIIFTQVLTSTSAVAVRTERQVRLADVAVARVYVSDVFLAAHMANEWRW